MRREAFPGTMLPIRSEREDLRLEILSLKEEESVGLERGFWLITRSRRKRRASKEASEYSRLW